MIIAFLSSDINVLTDVVFPIILPTIITLIVIGVPLIILILKNQKKKNAISKQIAQAELSMIKGFYDQNPITKPDKRLIGDFIEKNVLISNKNKFYLIETLENIKKELPPKKQRKKEDQDLITGIERAQENIKLSTQARKRRDDKEAKEQEKKLKNKKT
ncbi:MAG: hypothetical protein RR599_04970 [Victivallaceae bacterium]